MYIVTRRKHELRDSHAWGKNEARWLVDVHIEQASASLENGSLRSTCMPITTK